tara:strand:- start:9777 stop:10211 length:435 start_codon:yes stop_codon:yes gene_type:complete
MIRFVPTTMDYIERFEPQAYQKQGWKDSVAFITEDLLESTRTLVAEDYPVAVLGAVHRWEKYWQGWTVYSQKMIDEPTTYVRPMKRAIASLFEEIGMDRLEITTPCDHYQASKLAEFLGFKHEGRVRKYGRDGMDHHLYAKVRE